MPVPIAFLIVSVVIAVTFRPPQVEAVTFFANTTGDAHDATVGDGSCVTATGLCTLRAAIEESNALVGPDAVVLGPGKHKLLLGRVAVSGSLAISGVSPAETLIARGGIDILEGADLSMSQLTITRAKGGHGGALSNRGTLNLTDVALTRNHAALGGAIFNGRGNSIDNFGTTSCNNAPGHQGGTVTATNVTISSNRAGAGAGIFSDCGTVVLTNVTIVNNRASGSSGGVDLNYSALFPNYIGGSIVFRNVTIANNRGRRGVAENVAIYGPSLDLANTLISGRAGRANCDANAYLAMSSGSNLDSDGTCELTGVGDLSGLDPLLGRLEDNGGPTYTSELSLMSPAIDAGAPAYCPSTDQRGVARPQGVGCDIGAYEFQP